MNGRILIAGPGRSGTSALVAVLEEAGLWTSARTGTWYPTARAGFESTLDPEHSPTVVKNPRLTASLPSMLDAGVLVAHDIAAVLIPVRALDDAASSRWQTSRLARRVDAPGGLWLTSRPTQQSAALARGVWTLLLSLEEHSVPYRLMHYPRFVTDFAYFSSIIAPLAPEVAPETWERAWRDVVDTTLVRSDLRRPTLLDDLAAGSWRLRRGLRRSATRPWRALMTRSRTVRT